eukprot:gnl/TRDRNA2_/TRDRNA2_35478_c0_seq1.p1 gnl/TRDRNA2_/TRDRNA2_35478_c0~~gnl/TRDRNA2_/TRDRNA2_35478_c0_seq1.p1  ORF type:complete len:320 (+),score=16.56 gnl/TRDRNA2_/TRDRNA2_35478_c0_seq1:37-960(+)
MRHAGRCEPGGCRLGYGRHADGACYPCMGEHCHFCDAPEAPPRSVQPSKPNPTSLACARCESEFGLVDNATCAPCSVPGCAKCPGATHCEACGHGLVLIAAQGNTSVQECASCAAHCRSCDRLGPGQCDPGNCDLGYSLTPGGLCATCSGHCLNCTSSGPGTCDPGQCKAGYGLQGSSECSKCYADHCQVCDADKGQCEICDEEYGLTPERTCEACAPACKRCTLAGACAECHAGFALAGNKCIACADQCDMCGSAGPGQCDEGGCVPGWKTHSDGEVGGMICIPCTDPTCRQVSTEHPAPDGAVVI